MYECIEVGGKTFILESERLKFRKLGQEDFKAAAEFLMDEQVMYAWEHGFSEEEVREWIEKNIERYKKHGFSYFAAIEKASGALIGVMGPLMEEVEGESFVGIAYILNKKYWGQGFAEEGARACVEYAFEHLGAEKVIAEIRPENKASRKVAEKLEMKEERSFVKLYNGKEMPHIVYAIEK